MLKKIKTTKKFRGKGEEFGRKKKNERKVSKSLE